MKIRCKGLYKPVKAHPDDAGYDISCIHGGPVWARGDSKFDTGLSMEIPEGFVGLLHSRSGLAFKHSIEVGAGVIDPSFRGDIRIKLYNHGNSKYMVEPGDRIAQILIIRAEDVEWEQVEFLNNTVRGESCLGSTGVKRKEVVDVS